MELLVKIIEVLPARDAQYTDRQTGQTLPFHAQPVIMTDGFSTFYAELINDVATMCHLTDADSIYYKADVRFSCRKYTDSKGQVRYQTEATVRSICMWS